MPILSSFYGIIIRMYFQLSEHNPPHFHARYGEYAAEISIQTGEVLSGFLPPKAFSLVHEWANIHREELIQMWNTQDFKPISPLE